MKNENLKKITELRHQLHQWPELSLKEHATKQRLMEFLRENTEMEIEDHGKWFCAISYGKRREEQENADILVSCEHVPKKGVIAFRADMDALPLPETIELPYGSQCFDVSHKCGHDGHCAALCGLALTLNDMPAERDVILVFQHAEEIGQGGEECARYLKDRDVSEVFAFHNLPGYPKGALVFRRGLSQPASKGLTLNLVGQTSHASDPGKGRNPACAVAELIQCALHLPGMFPDDGFMRLCTIVHAELGQKDFGVSAGAGSLSVTLRAEKEAEMDEMEKCLRARAMEAAHRDGLQVSFEETDYFPQTLNHEDSLKKVLMAAEELGIQTVEMQELWRASEDFGYYTALMPGAIFYIGCGEDYPPLHTPEYDFNDEILPVAVDVFLQILRKNTRKAETISESL